MLIWLPFASLLALLAVASIIDVRERRIPNWLTASVAALYPLYVLVSPTPVAWLGALGAAVALFLIGFVLFTRNLIGGGDVKLIAAVALWAGIDQLALFALVTTLVGGALAIGWLWYRRWHGVVDAHLAGLGWNLASVARVSGPTSMHPELAKPGALTAAGQQGTTLPYAIAIAAGGFAVVADLVKF